MKVGVPRALSYYRYFPLWKTLLEEMGAEVRLSSKTGKSLLERGVRECVDDICVPVKLYFGHILDLEDVDYVLVSRLVSVEKGNGDAYTCPKLIGLPDMIKSSLPDIPIAEFVVDINSRSLLSSAKELAEKIGVRKTKARPALENAIHCQKRYESMLLSGLTPEEAMGLVFEGDKGEDAEIEAPESGDIKIALVGHEYLIFDPYLGHNITGKLRKLGARVCLQSEIPENLIREEIEKYPKISWSYEKELLGAASIFLNSPDVDGIIFVMGFACGPDSIISEIITREVRKPGHPPIINIVLDEHTGEAGVLTRVEAFCDLVRMSKVKARKDSSPTTGLFKQ
jgi:predicted nucleotide-binding protein (sugar kinase/HSP70/actin superfamily)